LPSYSVNNIHNSTHGTKSLREAAFEFNIPGVVADDKDYQPCEYDDEGEDSQVSSVIRCSLIVYTHVITCVTPELFNKKLFVLAENQLLTKRD